MVGRFCAPSPVRWVGLFPMSRDGVEPTNRRENRSPSEMPLPIRRLREAEYEKGSWKRMSAKAKKAAAKKSAGGTRNKKDVAYDEKAIQTLDALEHIRLRTGM